MLKEHRLRPVWRGMKARCYNPNSPKYKDYGKRGITVCDEWKWDFLAFRTWAETNGYQEGLTIDRINVNGNYEPSNCRFISLTENNRNKRNTVRLMFNREERTIFEWSEISGIPYHALYGRIHYHGWSIEDALTIPIGKRR